MTSVIIFPDDSEHGSSTVHFPVHEDGHGSSDIETKEYSPKYIRGCGIHTAPDRMFAAHLHRHRFFTNQRLSFSMDKVRHPPGKKLN